MQTLGLPISASVSLKEIRKSYRQLARKLHPDVSGPGGATEEAFRQVVAAYEHLVEEEDKGVREMDKIREAFAKYARYREKTRIFWRAKLRARWKLVTESKEVQSFVVAAACFSTSQVLANLVYY